jgi:competence protein ComEC
MAQTGCCRLERLRQELRDRLLAVPAPAAGRALLVALVLGDRSGLGQDMRRVLATTGVTHLLAISGLHISLAAGLAGLLVGLLWRRTRLCRRLPANIAGATAGLLAAGGYVLLSGLGLPAQRAFLMLLAGVWLLWRRQWREPWVVFGQVLFLVLLFQPEAVAEAGLWLSFVAVGAMLAALPHLRGRPPWLAIPLLQLAVSLCLYPVLLAFDMPLAPVGLLVNLVAVPVFSLFLIPAALGAALLAWLPLPGDWAVSGVAQLLDWAWLALAWLARQATFHGHPAWSMPMLALLGLAVLLWLAPPGLPARAAGLVLLLAAHLPRPPGLPPGAYRLDVLDVGQGLATVIRTRHHVLMYDTGARYPSGFNLADAVDLPWLRHHGISDLDLLVLSHGDNDHAGAAGRLLAQIRARRVLSGEPDRLEVASQRCPSRYFWRWDGVLFGFIQPPEARRWRGNNSSCVLLVDGPGGRMLITGDSERRMERLMLPTLRAFRPIDLVVAGHHGSTTSSSAAFVTASGAREVVYSAGYRNRYHFPRAEVDRRWWRVGARRWRTDGCGRIEVDFLPGARPPRPRGLMGKKRDPDPIEDVPCRMTAPPPSSMIR